MAFLMKRYARGSTEAREAIADFDRSLKRAQDERVARIAKTMTTIPQDWQQAIDEDVAFVMETTEAREALREARTRKRIDRSTLMHFQVSSRFLKSCHAYLTGDAKGHERLHLVTGSITPDGLRVLSQIEHVPFDEKTKSAGYVAADPGATQKLLVELDREETSLLGMWHSHISRGEESTRPSRVDLDCMERFVRSGWDHVLGGIMSMDGYFRLFTTSRPFDVTLYGAGANIVRTTPRETVIKIQGV